MNSKRNNEKKKLQIEQKEKQNTKREDNTQKNLITIKKQQKNQSNEKKVTFQTNNNSKSNIDKAKNKEMENNILNKQNKDKDSSGQKLQKINNKQIIKDKVENNNKNNELMKKDLKINKTKDSSNIDNKESIITEEKLKEMLKGQKHIVEQPRNYSYENKPKKEIIIRPRESYLKEKISTMESKYSQDLLSNINKELSTQLDNIKKELSEKDIDLSEIPKHLNKNMTKSQERDNIYSSSPNLLNNIKKDDFSIKKNYKEVRDLKNKQNKLKKNLIKIIENEKLLENESLLNDSNNKGKIEIDNNIKIQHLKLMKKEKDKIIEEIKILDSKINNLIINDKSKQHSKNEIIKNYIENFNRDKEITAIQIKKYLLESKKQKNKRKNEINLLKEKREKELDLIEKEREKKKEENLLKFKEEQKNLQLKQLKVCEKKTLKCKPYVREKPEKNVNLYLFQINNKKFIKNQKQLQTKENMRRKEYMKAINFKELKEFSDQFEEKKAKNEEKNIFKKKNLLKEWKERKSFLPSYKSQSFELFNKEAIERAENIENKKEIKDKLRKLKQSFSEKVKEEFYPTINKKLFDKRMDLIKELEKPIFEKYKYNYFPRKKKKVILKKIDPSKYKWKLKLEGDIFDKMNNSDMDMDMRYLIKRPKKINLFSLSNHNKLTQNNININKNIDNKSNTNKDIKILYKKILKKKWNESMDNINQNISEFNNKADNLAKKINEEKQLLRIGGIKYNIEQDKKVASLLIDSIKVKMNILNQIEK